MNYLIRKNYNQGMQHFPFSYTFCTKKTWFSIINDIAWIRSIGLQDSFISCPLVWASLLCLSSEPTQHPFLYFTCMSVSGINSTTPKGCFKEGR